VLFAATNLRSSAAFQSVAISKPFIRPLRLSSLPAYSGGGGSRPLPTPPPGGDEEREYLARLAEAEAAMAAVEEARLKLKKSNSPGIQTRALVSYSDAGTLVLSVPPAGADQGSIMSGAFSLAWFSAIVPATLTAGAPLLFLAPFWAAGGLVAKKAVYDPFIGTELTVGRYAWTLRSTFAGAATVQEVGGSTDELRGAAFEVPVVVSDDGVPQGEVRLYGTSGAVSFGVGLGMDELEYIAGLINDHLRKIKETPLGGEFESPVL